MKGFLLSRNRTVVSAATAGALLALLLPGGTAQAATSVGLGTLELSSHSALATEVTYTVGFVATSGLAAGDTVKLTGAAGTTFPANGASWVLADDTTGDNGGALTVASAGATATATVSGITVSPGDQVTITATGIGNGPATGRHILAVSTSVDTAPVNLPFTTAAKRGVGSVTVQLSSTAVNATGVTYTVGFTATDGLWADESTITLTAPSGTKFPVTDAANSAYFVNDDDGPSNSCGPSPISVNGAGNVVTLTCGGAGAKTIPAGHRVLLNITGVKNVSTAGTKTLSVTTTSDPKAVSASYILTSQSGATSVATPMLTRSSTATGATGTTWTVGFTATQGWYESQLKLTAPAGAVFPTSTSDYTPYNDSSGNSYGITKVATSAHAVTLEADSAADFSNDEFLATPGTAGDHITLVITGVTNPTGTGSLTISTGADPVAASIPLTGSASTPNLTLSSESAGAAAVEYTAGFTATITQTVTTVNLAFPGGTGFQASTAPCDLVRDDTTGQQSICLSPTVSGDTLTLQTPSTFGQFTVSAGDYVTVQAFGLTNTSAGARSVGLTSSAASGPVTLPGFTLTAATPVTGPSVILDSYAAGATQASYAVSFTASEGLDAGGDFNLAASTVTITVPGASFPISNVCDLIFDGSTGQTSDCPNNPPTGSGGDTITFSDINARITPGDQVTVFFFGADNPAATGSTQLSVSTSGSNAAASPPAFTLTAAPKVTEAALWLSSPAHGAPGVTYTVGFAADNGLTAGDDTIGSSTVTISAPAGTVFPDSGCTGVSVRDDTYWTSGCVATTGGGTNVLTISTPGVQPKDHVTVTIQGVTNAAAGPKTLHISTSSDATAVAVTYHLT